MNWKRAIAISAAAVLAASVFTPAAAQPKRVTYPTYDYRVCERNVNLGTEAYTCFKSKITRQSDGDGLIIHDRRIYNNPVPPTAPPCSSRLYDDPAVYNYSSYIWSFPPSGTHVVWESSVPDLSLDNGCYHKYDYQSYPGGVILTNTPHVWLGWSLLIRAHHWNDDRQDMYLDIGINPVTQNLNWSCGAFYGEVEICDRSLVQ